MFAKCSRNWSTLVFVFIVLLGLALSSDVNAGRPGSVDPNSDSSIGFSDANEVAISPQTVTVNLYLNTAHDGINHVPSEYETIQAAIDDCDDGDVVIIAEGTYIGNGNRDIDFLGKAITVRSTDPNNRNVVAATVIDCQGSVLEPHRGFYFHSSEGSDSILNGLTITNGYVSGNWADGSGGGIICYYNTSPTIKNCMVTNNTAKYHGGGIYSYRSSPTLINCILRANWAGGNGGGMHNGPSSPNLINCIFTENTSGSYGGGMSATSTSSPTLTNCTFSGNSGLSGGAIVVFNSNAVLTNCILWGDVPEEVYVYVGDMPHIAYSNIQGGFGGTGNIGTDPRFVDPDNDDYHLLPDSSGINTGNPNYIPGPNETDLDGNPRVNGGRIDMGAYEFNLNTAPITVDDDGPADFNNIQAAIDAAVDGDTILVADGTYTGTAPRQKGHFETITIIPLVRVGDYTFHMSKGDVLKKLGKPEMIFYGEERYTLGNLPRMYYMDFNDISFLVIDDSVKEISVRSPLYKFTNGLGVGDSEQKIKQAFGDDFHLKETKWKDFLIYKYLGLAFEVHKDNRTIMEINVVPRRKYNGG